MPNRPWKATERAVARALGGERIPVTGRRGPDVRHRWLAVEVKHRRRLPRWLQLAVAQAHAGAGLDQLPVVVLHQAGRPHREDLVVLRLEDFQEWFGDPDTEP